MFNGVCRWVLCFVALGAELCCELILFYNVFDLNSPFWLLVWEAGFVCWFLVGFCWDLYCV